MKDATHMPIWDTLRRFAIHAGLSGHVDTDDRFEPSDDAARATLTRLHIPDRERSSENIIKFSNPIVLRELWRSVGYCARGTRSDVEVALRILTPRPLEMFESQYEPGKVVCAFLDYGPADQETCEKFNEKLRNVMCAGCYIQVYSGPVFPGLRGGQRATGPVRPLVDQSDRWLEYMFGKAERALMEIERGTTDRAHRGYTSATEYWGTWSARFCAELERRRAAEAHRVRREISTACEVSAPDLFADNPAGPDHK